MQEQGQRQFATSTPSQQATALQIVVCAGQSMMRPIDHESQQTKFDVVSQALRLLSQQYRGTDGHLNVLLATTQGVKTMQLTTENYDTVWQAKQTWTGTPSALPAFRLAENAYPQQSIAFITDSLPSDMDMLKQSIGALAPGVKLFVYIIGNDEQHRSAVEQWTQAARSHSIKVTSLTGQDNPNVLAQNILSAVSY